MSIQSGILYDGGSDNDPDLRIIDQELDSRIKSLKKAELELEEIMNDPFLEQTRAEVASMPGCSGNIRQHRNYRASADFIRCALSESQENTGISKGIKDYRMEIGKRDVNDLSAEWVREWHRKKQMEVYPSSADTERKSFIASSLEPVLTEDKTVQNLPVRNKYTKLLRFSALAAAAILGLFITFNTLVPSRSSEQLFNSFYTPYQAVSTVTRGIDNNTAGNPQGSDVLFLSGLSQIEAGNIDEAIVSLSSVINNSGSYVKEARWYLGLAYLKKDERNKAAGCFDILASSEGYYNEPSRKILRRLK